MSKKAQWYKDAKARARQERESTNRILRAHGYRWRKEDEESMDFAGPNAFRSMYGDVSHVWILSGPDGRDVSEREAMTALADTGIEAAREWLATHPAQPSSAGEKQCQQ